MGISGRGDGWEPMRRNGGQKTADGDRERREPNVSQWADTLRERARAGLPPVDGELRVDGLHGAVEVIRDRWGVPHIYAGDEHDLFFAANFVACSERLFQLDFLLRLANGRLSELISQLGLPIDRFFRTVGLNRAGRTIADTYDGRSLEILDAALRGANEWIERMPARPVEYEVLDLDPEPFPTGTDGAAYGSALSALISWGLSGNWDNELLRWTVAERLGPAAMRALFPDIEGLPAPLTPGALGVGAGGSTQALDLLRHAVRPPSMQGSNNWVVSGSRSVTGKPLLANDPHLAVQSPSPWFELHLNAPGIDVAGVSLPLVVGVQIGHSDRIAWGLTNVGGDTQDLYVEQLNEDRTAARFDGRWEPVTVHHEEIGVRGHDDPVVLEVPETRHGPVLDSYLIGLANPEPVPFDSSETFSLQWTGLSTAVSPTTMVEMARARTMEEFREALRGWTCPGQNVVYADVDGHMGYQCTGLYPIRRTGDGTVPVPGWRPEYEWTGWVPYEELPSAVDPEEGFLATANQRIHDERYPYLIGVDFLPPHRARRIGQLLTSEPVHSKDSFARMHSDVVSPLALELLPFLLEVEAEDGRARRALEILAAWDGSLAADSAAAAIYQVWCMRIAEEILLPKMGRELADHYHARRESTIAFQYTVLPTLLEFPTAMWFGRDGHKARDELLRRALGKSLDELTERCGDDMAEWSWGAIHRVRFAGALAMIPELEELFTAGEAPWGGDDTTICQGLFEPGAGSYDVCVVPSWRQILDVSDWDASIGIHTVGQSGNPASPHFADLFELWSSGEYHPMPFTRAAVEEAAEGCLRLTR
jgi:penicillin G amidase